MQSSDKRIRHGGNDDPIMMEAMMILRLSYPNRWCDLVPLFGRAEEELSVIFSEILNDIYNGLATWSILLNLHGWIQSSFHRPYTTKVSMDQCWRFIDGTARPIARPIRNQRIIFSGHKRSHCLKFQSVEIPNGLIAHLFGPIERRRHDAFMLAVSGL